MLQGFEAQGAFTLPMQRESGIRELSGLPRVLIVDDQEDAAELLGMLLADQGYQVKLAHDGTSALALALDFRPQIALLDIGLPVLDGYQLAVLLRAMPTLAECRLIALSGYCDDMARARSKAAGFDLHLAKPLTVDELLRAIAPPEQGHTASAQL